MYFLVSNLNGSNRNSEKRDVYQERFYLSMEKILLGGRSEVQFQYENVYFFRKKLDKTFLCLVSTVFNVKYFENAFMC